MFVYRDESGEGNIDILDCGTIYILYVNSGTRWDTSQRERGGGRPSPGRRAWHPRKKRGEKREEEGKTWRRISICSWADRILLHRRQAPCKSSCNSCKSPPSDLRRCLTCFCSVKSPSTCKISVKRLEPLSPFLSSLLILLILPIEK